MAPGETPATPAVAPVPAPAGSSVWALAALLAFVAGYVDTVGFVAIFGVFTAHVTGNFVLIGASLAHDTGGLVTKLLTLPTFLVTVAVVAAAIRRRVSEGRPPQRGLLVAQTGFLILATAVALAYQPFDRPDGAASMVAALLMVVSMALQNAASRLVFTAQVPTTVMTGNVTQLVIDLVEVSLIGRVPARAAVVARIRKFWPPIAAFAIGAIGGALLYVLASFGALALPVVALVFACARVLPAK